MRKHVIIVPDGAADEQLAQFGGKTVIEAASTPNMDKIAMMGRQGLVHNVPEGMEPGSDVAMMSLLGYDPARYYTGRAPIEAAAKKIRLGPRDWAFRCNLVTIADGLMADHSAGHITTQEAASLIKDIASIVGRPGIEFYVGVSYRHLVIFRDTDFEVQTYPPHDYLGKPVEDILPRGKGAELLRDLMARSAQLLADHQVNQVRTDLGENPANAIWLWGQGRHTVLERFEKRFGIKGAAITAVDLVRGLARLVGFELIEVEGATGFFETNYAGKGQAAIEALGTYDLVLVHIEAPDEASHQGDADLKKAALERIDQLIVGPVLDALTAYPAWRIMVLPDHPTPIRTRAHSEDPVPFAMAGEGIDGLVKGPFSESVASKAGLVIESGHQLMDYFLRG
ncbi:MAG: cofactor-independent phosphoglycerate mutase [Sedimentisphaerales bacterium]|nr:cofactor-independent phosphoglycerate mutase [Sedimentisphaerales bacterium]